MAQQYFKPSVSPEAAQAATQDLQERFGPISNKPPVVTADNRTGVLNNPQLTESIPAKPVVAPKQPSMNASPQDLQERFGEIQTLPAPISPEEFTNRFPSIHNLPDMQKPLYAEEASNNVNGLNVSIDKPTLIRSRFQSLHEKVPRVRAEIGAQFGIGAGQYASGPVGAVLGAGVGALAGRAIGIIQTGEKEDHARKDKVLDTLKTMKIVNPRTNRMRFGDLGESSFPLVNSPDFQLENKSSITGKPARTLYEIDKTHPFTQRALTVSKPLAHFLAEGLLNYSDIKNNPRDRKAVDNTVNLLANTLIDNAKSEDDIYSRARVLANQLGAKEDQIRTFFDKNKKKYSDSDALNIRKGLDIIYARL